MWGIGEAGVINTRADVETKNTASILPDAEFRTYVLCVDRSYSPKGGTLPVFQALSMSP
jgi:hypothetical protein